MRRKSDRWIIGLTGKNAAGKGEVAQYLREHGYEYRSLSDILREEAKRRGSPSSREVLIQLGRELRVQGGPGVLAEMTVPLLLKSHYVIDSIRNPVEVDILEKAGRFLLIGLGAPVEIRFERAKKRGRIENAATLEKFVEMENRERTDDPLAQQLDPTIDRAHKVLSNDGTLDDLLIKVRSLVEKEGFPL